jgi:hypothetical protein
MMRGTLVHDPSTNRPPEPLDVSLVTSDAGGAPGAPRENNFRSRRSLHRARSGAAKFPAKITTETEAKKAIDWIAEQCKRAILEAETAHP